MEEFFVTFIKDNMPFIVLLCIIMLVPFIKIVKQIIRKIYFNEVRFTKKLQNGLEEHYINDDHRFYTLNGEIITGRGLNKMIYNDDNYFFILNSVKEHSEVDEETSMSTVWYTIVVTLYDYNGNQIFREDMGVNYWRDFSEIENQIFENYNDEIIKFCGKYLYFKEVKTIIKIEKKEQIIFDQDLNKVKFILPGGETIIFNTNLEQINVKDGIVYTGKRL